MFDLSQAITAWRQRMAAKIHSPEILDELECHLRDDIGRQVRSGTALPEAFEAAVGRIGDPSPLGMEFAKMEVKSGHSWMRVSAKVAGLFCIFLFGLALLQSAAVSFPFNRIGAAELWGFAAVGVALVLLFSWLRRQDRGLGALAWRPVGDTTLTLEARFTLECARNEAQRLGHNYIGTEHVLLGLINAGNEEIPAVFEKMGVPCEKIRTEIEKLIGRGPQSPLIAKTPLTPRVKRALGLAAKETNSDQGACLEPKHLLLGLIREGDGVAARALKSLGVEVERTRRSLG
jgi:hypothetical protein